MAKQKTLQVAVLERFLSAREMADLFTKYQENLKSVHGRATREATAQDIKIFSDYKRGMGITELKRKYAISEYAVRTAIIVAAIA